MHLWLKWQTCLTLCAFGTSFFFQTCRKHSHVLHCDVLEDLTVVNIPHSLVIPNLGSQQDGSQNDALPVGRADIQLSVGQKTFQIHLERKCFIRQLIMKQNTSHIGHAWPEETFVLWLNINFKCMWVKCSLNCSFLSLFFSCITKVKMQGWIINSESRKIFNLIYQNKSVCSCMI